MCCRFAPNPNTDAFAPGSVTQPNVLAAHARRVTTIMGRPHLPPMIATPITKAAIFVDGTCPEHWIVCDPEGNFWVVPPVENTWKCRQPFRPTEQTALEAIPGHYRFMHDLPF
jgi:hypothetical protein